MWYGISKSKREKIEKELKEQHRRELTEELIPEIIVQLGANMRNEIRKEIQKKILDEKPIDRQREAFRQHIVEIEIDAHANAIIASEDALAAKEKLRSARKWGALRSYFLFYAVIATFVGGLYLFGATWPSALAFGFVALACIVSMALNSDRYGALQRKINRLNKTSSDYMRIAEKAKSYRMFHAERIETKRRLDECAEELSYEKEQLDKEYHPNVSRVYHARDASRIRIDSQRVRFDDFDDRLAEAVHKTEGLQHVKA